MPKNETPQTIGAKLAEARRAKGMSVSLAARIGGCSKATLLSYEHGRHVMDVRVLAKLLNLYGVDANYVLDTVPRTHTDSLGRKWQPQLMPRETTPVTTNGGDAS